ncbi:MAG: hypothetical protein WAO52_19775 [Prolixibacteraceae bacterium]
MKKNSIPVSSFVDADVPYNVKTYSGVGKITENSLAIPTVSSDNYSVIPDKKGIRVYAKTGEIVSVYSTDGRLLQSKKLNSKNTFLPLNVRGIILVKISNSTKFWSKKINR